MKFFDEIRDKPYRISVSINERADNCYFKSIDLSEKLIPLGYTIRSKLGEMDWHSFPMPENIKTLIPKNVIQRHFYLEIFIDNEWRILDPSLPKSLATNLNLPYSKFGKNNKSCFEMTRIYSPQEQSDYMIDALNNPQVWNEYFEKSQNFLKALNLWLTSLGPDTIEKS